MAPFALLQFRPLLSRPDDVTPRRCQKFKVPPNAEIRWRTPTGESGTTVADAEQARRAEDIAAAPFMPLAVAGYSAGGFDLNVGGNSVPLGPLPGFTFLPGLGSIPIGLNINTGYELADLKLQWLIHYLDEEVYRTSPVGSCPIPGAAMFGRPPLSFAFRRCSIRRIMSAAAPQSTTQAKKLRGARTPDLFHPV